MNSLQLSEGCQQWVVGSSTKHPPQDKLLLEALAEAGFMAFTGPSGLCGGKSESRTVLAIHRGRGTNWEIVFRENDLDVVTTTTDDLEDMTHTMLAWLKGQPLSAAQNSIRAAAG